ncbi:MAG: DsrE family protein [Patescibacteria group bacterium]
MKLGIILQSNKPEHAWNTFRLGITALKAGHQVEIFLMNEGSELDTISDTKDFDISARVAEFKKLSGEIYVCGTCIKLRGKEESKVCHISTISDLLKMVESSDKVLVFG